MISFVFFSLSIVYSMATIFGQLDNDLCSSQLDNDLSTIPTFSVRDELLHHSANQFPSPPQIMYVTEGVYVAIGYDLANSIIIETQTGIIIIDTLSETNVANKVFNDYKSLRINTRTQQQMIIEAIILTHYHTDHSMGVGFWLNLNIENGFDKLPKIYANEELVDGFKRFFLYSFFSIAKRAQRQFGTLMYHNIDTNIVNQKNLFINAGIGPHLNREDNITFINPQNNENVILISSKFYELQISNIELTLIHSPGETSDQTAIWYENKKVLFVGDNFYYAFPNLYSIRGTTPRDPKKWINSLDLFMEYRKYPAKVLVGSHTQPIFGENNIQNELVLYRDLIAFVHDQTVRYMMKQLPIDEIVEHIEISLPQILRQGRKQQFYGTVEWSVRSIYDMYLGWFQGEASELYPSNAYDRGQGLYEIMNMLYENKNNGNENMIETLILHLEEIIKCAINNKDDSEYIVVALKEERWALEIITSLITYYENMNTLDKKCNEWNQMMELRWKIMRNIAERSVSANGRNYLISQYLEERFSDLTDDSILEIETKSVLLSFPIDWIFELLRFRVKPEAFLNLFKTEWITNIKFKDSGLMFQLHLRNGGVLSIKEYSKYGENIINDFDEMADLIYLMNEIDFKNWEIGLKHISKGGLINIVAFWSKFDFSDLLFKFADELQLFS